MKLKDFTFEVYVAILDIYAEICGGKYLANSLKNETKYNDLISEFETRSSIERRLGSNLCSFSKLWIRRDWDDALTFSFDAKLTSEERRRLGTREKEMTEKFNARISEFISFAENAKEVNEDLNKKNLLLVTSNYSTPANAGCFFIFPNVFTG